MANVAVFSVGGRVRGAVEAALQDLAIGLNAQLAIETSRLSIDPIQFDWTPGAGQYYPAYISFEDIVSKGEPVFPICCVYEMNMEDQRQRKYFSFSGAVQIGVSFYLSRIDGNAPVDTEWQQDAIENAFFASLHDAVTHGMMAQSGAYSLRDTVFVRGEIEQGAENWVLPSAASFTCLVDQ